MKKKHNLTLGYLGEEEAAKYIESKGFKIIERNFKKRYSEVDIVSMDGTTLVFVEVKTRIGDEYGTPEEAITYWKRRCLIRSANYYCMLYPDLGESMRIDLVSVSISQDRDIKIDHFKNITG